MLYALLLFGIAMSLPFLRVAWRVAAIMIAIGIIATMIATGERN